MFPPRRPSRRSRISPSSRRLAPKWLVCQVDLRQGHGRNELDLYRRLGEETGAEIVLEIVTTGGMDPAAELMPLAAAVAAAGLTPAAIAVFPAPRPEVGAARVATGRMTPPLADIYRGRAQGLSGRAAWWRHVRRIFTELNRKRPPVALLDYVTNTTSPNVHAADDGSVMETLEALPYVIKSAKAIIGKTPYRVGPSAIPARQNPYGAASAPNPDNERVCLSRMDPRQRGLFGAAWTLGYVARFAQGGLQAITMGSATGPAGMIYRRDDYAQPYFDALSGPAVYPVFHLMADLGAARGRRQIASKSDHDSTMASLAYRGEAGPVLWLANLTPRPISVRVKGFAGPASLSVLDEGSFARATTDAGFLHKGGKRVGKVGVLTLRAYALARIAAIAR